MSKDDHIILGIHISDRLKHAASVQQALTEFGSNIKTRLGLHETGEGVGSPNGLLILELAGDSQQCVRFEKTVSAIEGVDVQKMVFEHD